MSPQEQNKIRNYLLRRIDYSDLKSIIDQNYRYAKNEFDQDYSFYDFNHSIAVIIVEDLHIMDHIDLHIEQMYDKLVEYFYILLEKRTRKLYDKLTKNTNLQEQISRMKSMMGVISEKLEDIQGTPLYHKTSTHNGIDIIESDSLRGNWASDEYLRKDKRLANTKTQMSISFTRDKNWQPDSTIGGWIESGITPLEDPGMTFVVDRDKLKTKYKIEPFNYQGIEPNSEYKEKFNELEERVMTNEIYPLHKYVIDIIYTGGYPKVQEIIDNYLNR
jgi:hypothetical protein